MYEKFVELLHERGITAYRVAKDTGVTQTTLSDWKTGRATPKLSTLQKIADYFEVSLDYLAGNTDNTQKAETDSNQSISGVYLSFAREAENNGIDPEDIKLAIDTIKRLRGQK